jgi:hypothetical protein
MALTQNLHPSIERAGFRKRESSFREGRLARFREWSQDLSRV